MTDQPLNLDLNKQVTILPDQFAWVSSPSDGVSRMPFEREQAESGRTTSLVKFAPGASFAPHTHPLGEEIYVLEGVFSDENGDYPAGTYIRNPPGSRHKPFTREGCTLFVKLDQFHPDDDQAVVIKPDQRQWQPGIGKLEVLPLHSFQTQSTALVFWPENEVFQPHTHFGGEEILVLEGKFCDEHGHYPKYSWIRNPHMSRHHPFVEQASLILVKVGHLPSAQAPGM
ncbi:MAG: cupin domain-containing protein [bacterium]